MREKGWSREFDGPVDLQHGRQLVTLEDAGNYITKASESRAFRSGMASGDGSSDTRRNARRADHVG
jgi:hypothetical protein